MTSFALPPGLAARLWLSFFEGSQTLEWLDFVV